MGVWHSPFDEKAYEFSDSGISTSIACRYLASGVILFAATMQVPPSWVFQVVVACSILSMIYCAWTSVEIDDEE